MATHNQNGASSTTWAINDSNDTWNLGPQAVITVGYALGEAYGINEALGQLSNVINIKGDVMANGPWGVAAVQTKVHVFEGAKLASDTGILSTSHGAIIINEGTIAAKTGIDAHNAKRVTNGGDITGGDYGITATNIDGIVNSGEVHVDIVGINMQAGGSVLRNLAGGVIDAGSIGVQISGAGSARVVNDGEIIGGLVDIAADLTIINRNRLEGDFDLGAGNDVFDSRKGKLVGLVEGGLGDDIFKISSHPVTIQENFDEGHDKVISSASHDLAHFVEGLTFIGSKNINGTGNDGANTLIGNRGNNAIHGDAGADMLNGGAGRDRLYGGAHDDVFIFRKGSGKDVIEDFEDGTDLLRLGSVASDKAMQDLLDNHIEQRGNDLVITYGADRLTIRDLDLAFFSKDDLAKLDF
jgi:serralysin